VAAALTTRRLPGFRFDAQPPPLTEALPRMDVAVFVGFAASGPLDTPVVVEDAAQFEAVFGGEVALAWDRERGDRVRAHLAPAVHAFFRNGGRRCWVVRVAGGRARANLFPVPGLLRVRANGSAAPAYACARSAGSWSDSLQTSTALLTRPLRVVRFGSQFDFDLEATPRVRVEAGDLLRLAFGERYVLLVVVRKVEPLPPPVAGSPPVTVGPPRLRVTGSFAQWFRTAVRPPVPQHGRARVFTATGARTATRVEAYDDWLEGGRVRLSLSLPATDAPAPGSFVQARFGRRLLWLLVSEVRALGLVETEDEERVEVAGEALWWLRRGPKDVWADNSQPTADGLPLCEKLLFELFARRGDGEPVRLSNLGFSRSHERFWGALPSDEELYGEAAPGSDEGRERFRREASSPRFNLAGRGGDASAGVFLPLGMPFAARDYLGRWKRAGDALVRDGLDRFGSELFLDADLAETGTEDLLSRADFLRYQSDRPRALRGVHAALSIEEATIVAVPDAVHRGWRPTTDEALQKPEASERLPHPEWFDYLECNPRPRLDKKAEPEGGHFLDCRLRRINPPELEAAAPDASGSFQLTWSSAIKARKFTLEESASPDWRGARVVYAGTKARAVLTGRDPQAKLLYRVRAEVAGIVSDWVEVEGRFETNGDLVLAWEPPLEARYVLEESASPAWLSSVVIYRGLENLLPIYGRGTGSYYYRVRAEVGSLTSDWSNGVAVRVAPGAGWVQNASDTYKAEPLLEVQCALLRLCAARGDLFALLSLPEHYREERAVRHVAAIRPPSTLTQATDTPGGPIAPIRYGETRALSYGALYHPWLISSEDERGRALSRQPPDGAAAGILARRALERGAWVAPANEPLVGVVALAPPLPESARLDAQAAQVNLFLQDPRGFLAMSADTLSLDEDLRPIGVRRLLSLLRRLALRLGATYVFEPNGDAFRRLVRRGFEGLLGEMFSRGAFAGATPEASFRVVTNSELNTPQLADQGRFIVELKVAPSRPLTFLTLRLVQAGDRGLAAEER